MKTKEPTKRCDRCKKEKSVHHFNRAKRTADGLNKTCRACYRAYHNKITTYHPEGSSS